MGKWRRWWVWSLQYILRYTVRRRYIAVLTVYYVHKYTYFVVHVFHTNKILMEKYGVLWKSVFFSATAFALLYLFLTTSTRGSGTICASHNNIMLLYNTNLIMFLYTTEKALLSFSKCNRRKEHLARIEPLNFPWLSKLMYGTTP